MSDTFGKLKELMAKAGHPLPADKGSVTNPFTAGEFQKLREDNTATFPSEQEGDVPLTPRQQEFLGKQYQGKEATPKEITAGTRSRATEPDWMMENRLDALSEILNKKNRAPSSDNN